MSIDYKDMPKAIQELVDGAEFLDRVIKFKRNGKTVYTLEFSDSHEVWARYYDSNGNKISETPFLPKA